MKTKMVSVSLPAKLIKQIERICGESPSENETRDFIVFVLVDMIAACEEADGKCNRYHKKDIVNIIKSCAAEAFVSPKNWNAV